MGGLRWGRHGSAWGAFSVRALLVRKGGVLFGGGGGVGEVGSSWDGVDLKNGTLHRVLPAALLSRVDSLTGWMFK